MDTAATDLANCFAALIAPVAIYQGLRAKHVLTWKVPVDIDVRNQTQKQVKLLLSLQATSVLFWADFKNIHFLY